MRNPFKNIATDKTILLIISFVLLLGLLLSFPRDAIHDETIYLRESMIMAECFKDGIWVGNYATGLHGFLFKLPVALVFVFTGPSIFVATFFTIILSTTSCCIFYKILNHHFRSSYWALIGTVLLATSFRFVMYTPTFLREIPSLFTVLLFIEALLSKKNKWILGLLLLLILDAKEHVFFTIVPAYILWILLDEYIRNKKVLSFKYFKDSFLRILSNLLPSLTYLFLMFYTGIVPINMFNASILGLINKGLGWVSSQFTPEFATTNMMEGKVKYIYQIPISENITGMLRPIVIIINQILSYIGKVLYPRTFSFSSIPKIMIIPSLITSIHLFYDWYHQKKIILLFFPIVLWSYTLTFILRASHGRYLFPISPIIILLFLYFLRDTLKNKALAITTLAITSALIFAGLFFEVEFVSIKIFLNLVLFLMLLTLFYLYRKSSKLTPTITTLFIVSYCISTLGTSVVFSYLNGQIGQSSLWGTNRESKIIISNFDTSEKIWINDIGWGELPSFYRRDTYYNPEWKWNLKKSIPKKYMLKIKGDRHFYSYNIQMFEDFITFIENNSIEKIGLIESVLEDKKFNDEEYKKYIDTSSNFLYERTVVLKNKRLHIYKVVIINENIE